jgi:hypothetical protein
MQLRPLAVLAAATQKGHSRIDTCGRGAFGLRSPMEIVQT